jgi:hypothetical protein
MTEYLFDIFQKDKIYYQKIDFIRLNKDKCEKKKKTILYKISINVMFRTNQDLVYQQMRNFYLLSMPSKQYVNDKNQAKKLMFRQVLMATYDHYTKKTKNYTMKYFNEQYKLVFQCDVLTLMHLM